jgi:two-component system, chemotaxis family, chemotaxis protein CheY
VQQPEILCSSQLAARPNGRTSSVNRQSWVLVVEDDSVFRLLLTKAAGKCECNVHSATTIQSAIEHLGRQEYSLVLLDCHLPDGHSAEVARFAASPASKAPTHVVAISSDDSADNVNKILSAGAEEFVVKGASIGEIASMIKKYCCSEGDV